MVHEGRADNVVGGDIDWASSDAMAGSGAWNVDDDEAGEEDSVDIDPSR